MLLERGKWHSYSTWNHPSTFPEGQIASHAIEGNVHGLAEIYVTSTASVLISLSIYPPLATDRVS